MTTQIEGGFHVFIQALSPVQLLVAAVALFAPADRLDARIGANVMAAIIGVLAVAVGFMIHRRSPLTPWLALGLLPGLVGAYFTFR